MKSTILPALAGVVCTFVALHFLTGSSSQAAGSLNPPAGPPKPEMVSLSELSAQIQDVQSRLDARLPSGRNLAIASSDGSVSAWDHETGLWHTLKLGGVIGPMTESNGNFLFLSSRGMAAAWSKYTKKWTTVTFPSATIVQSAGSNGNFFLSTNTSQLGAWNKMDGAWSVHRLPNLLSSHTTSHGNALYIDTKGVTAIWNQESGQWASRNFSNFLIPVGSD